MTAPQGLEGVRIVEGTRRLHVHGSAAVGKHLGPAWLAGLRRCASHAVSARRRAGESTSENSTVEHDRAQPPAVVLDSRPRKRQDERGVPMPGQFEVGTTFPDCAEAEVL